MSVSDTILNLVGQRAACLENQLKAYKDGSRKPQSAGHPAWIMNAMAAQLSSAQIADVAAYFASLPGATGPTPVMINLFEAAALEALETELVGDGTHERVVVNVEKFSQRVKRKLDA